MEIPTCVIDANTLIDHIHQIKALVYNGHIHLAVPLSTVDRVDQQYRKSIEPKPEPEKATRPKSGGKPAKVYPAFDISPRVAKEFLERSSQEAIKILVDFQKDEEQYTTWKNLEIQEEQEKQKNAEGKPATFAAALLAKLNISEAPAEAPKGPVKPKLVARGPGATNSPWKRAVPTIALDGVPSAQRPLLGYMLWRLHERETYSFTKDSSILVSDDKEVSTIAQQLGITVTSFDSLRSKIHAENKPEGDISVRGELEREFGDIVKRTARSAKAVTHPNGSAITVLEVENIKGEVLVNEASKGIEAVTVEVERKDEGESQLEIVEKEADAQQPEEKTSEMMRDENMAPCESLQEQSATIENVPTTPRAWADVVSNRTRPVQPKSASPAPMNQNLSLPAEIRTDKSTDHLMDAAAQEKASTIADWVQKVKAAGSEPEAQRSPPASHKKPKIRKAKEPTPPPEEPPKPFRPILMQRTPNSSQITFDKGLSPPHTPFIEPMKSVEAVNHTPSASISSARSLAARAPSSDAPPSAKAPSPKGQLGDELPAHELSAKALSVENRILNDPEDSEEEVLVFNPRAKRISAQQPLPKQISSEKPNPPHVQEPVPVTLPADLSVVDQPQGHKQPSPDRNGPSRNRRQPKPRAPVVIDPDAFGRDFASNPRPHHHVPHHRGHQRPTSQNGHVQQRPVPQQGDPSNGLPPQRHAPQHGPPRPHPRGGRFQHGQVPPHRNVVQNGPNGHLANIQHGQGKPNGVSNSIENGNAINVAIGQPPLMSDGGASQEPQPDRAGLEVEYVVKSGSIRGSTRGRGKLWIP